MTTPVVVFLCAIMVGGGIEPVAYFTDSPGKPAMETCLKFKKEFVKEFGGRHRYECLPGTVEKKK